MFKPLKATSPSTPGSHHHHHAQQPSRSPSPIAISRSNSALHLLQQQRKQTRSSPAFSTAATVTRTVVHSGLSIDHHTTSPTRNTKPTTSRKKIKAKTAGPSKMAAAVAEKETPAAAEAEERAEDSIMQEGDTVMDETVDETAKTTADETVDEAVNPTAEPAEADETVEEAPKATAEAIESDDTDAEGEDDNPFLDRTPADKPDQSSSQQQNVVVCVRVRSVDQANANEEIWTMDKAKHKITPSALHPTIAKRSTTANAAGETAKPIEDGSAYDFSFDSLVVPNTSADDMYDERIAPVVGAVSKGYNGTVFAYGQTGSGKTFTMSGDKDGEQGVIPKAVDQIFRDVEQTSSREFLLRVSYLEIYNESLNDLLAALPSASTPASSANDANGRPSSPTKGGSSHMVAGNSGSAASSSLRLFDAGGRVQIQGLREEIVTTSAQVLDLLERGQKARHQAATDWNERSSRSHCVFMLTVESREKAKHTGENTGEVRFSQLNLIDLAGSERAATEKDRRKEGAFINKSLLTLGTVIAKLSEQSASGREEAHIPYRDSKLTRLLQTSLGGNARVAVVCTLSPLKEHAVESMSTLRFGQRCKMVVTRAKQGSVVDDKALIARYRRELDNLRKQLEAPTASPAAAKPLAADDPAIKALKDEKAKAERDVRDMNAQRATLKQQIEHLTRLILTGKDVEADQGGNGNGQEVETEFDKAQRLRQSRRSDMGTSSPSKRSIARFDSPNVLSPKRNTNDQENSFLKKPFALESELAQLRKSLNKALTAKQASEDARRKEVQLWQAKVDELEEANKEQEEELDEAEEAFRALKAERDTMRAKVGEEQEANRLLKLVAKSRTNDSITEEQRQMIEAEGQAKIDKLKEELRAERDEKAKMASTAEIEMSSLRQELSDLKAQKDEGSFGQLDRIAELERQLDKARGKPVVEQDASARAHDGESELAQLREQLRQAQEEKASVEKELRQSALDRGQEDAERDFDELVKQGHSAKASLDSVKADLAKAQEQLADRERDIRQQKLKIEELEKRANAKPLPVPSLSSSPAARSASFAREEDATSSPTRTANLERQLRLAEERCKLLEIQADTHKREALAATFKANTANPSPPLSSYDAPNSPSRSPKISGSAELRAENEQQRSSIAALETRLAEAQAVIRKLQQSQDGDESLASLKPGPFRAAFASRLSRGGSMREYKKYSGHQSVAGGDLAIATRSNEEYERAIKAEQEEVTRLNEVINSQRGLMSDLEESVATWKRRLRTQQDIIARLVDSGVKASPSLLAGAQTPQTTDSLAGTLPKKRATDLQRTSSIASNASSSSPYYGAHIYNRPPAHLGGAAHGLGLGSTSPTKGQGWLATMPGHRPDYATSAKLSSSSSLASPGKRRKTIEHEIASLKGSPRIESTKSRLLDPAMRSPTHASMAAGNPARGRGPLPVVPGSPTKGSSSQLRDWYI